MATSRPRTSAISASTPAVMAKMATSSPSTTIRAILTRRSVVLDRMVVDELVEPVERLVGPVGRRGAGRHRIDGRGRRRGCGEVTGPLVCTLRTMSGAYLLSSPAAGSVWAVSRRRTGHTGSVRTLVAVVLGAAVAALGALILGEYPFTGS